MDRALTFDAAAPASTSRDFRADRHGPRKKPGLRRRAVAIAGAIVIGTLASPPSAASEPSTRLIRCGEESCLEVSGRRADPATAVRINGRVVPVEGKHGWRVRLPIETVRQWSAPYARTIEVSLAEPEARDEAVSAVDLPIGLLGGVTELSSLVVSVR